MRYSQAMIITRKNVGFALESKSHELSVRAGLIHQLGSGLYDFLPMGQKVLSNIECIVREEMNNINALEVSFPTVQPLDLWKESGRYNTYGDEMIRFKNREGREFCLGPTHEEIVSQCARNILDSYKQLPFTLYQIGRKFRDEMRPRHGLIRCREFVMKDAYSFDKNEEEMIKTYNSFSQAYNKIFSRMKLRFVSVKANPGEIGGTGSEEFLAFSESGEDKFCIDSNGEVKKIEDLSISMRNDVQTGIEIGHIFQLGQVYSKTMNVGFTDNSGIRQFPYMGCYGIGISRLIATVIEQHYDAEGIVWPNEIAPFKVVIIPIQNTQTVLETADQIYQEFRKSILNPLIDDRDCAIGVKFKDASLIGVPLKIIVSISGLEKGIVEIEVRKTQKKLICRLDEVQDSIMSIYNNISM